MDRKVTRSGKDKNGNGNITHLCNPTATWSPRKAEDVIADLDRLQPLHRYYVDAAGYETNVTVVKRTDGTKYLRTTADKTSKNNLDNLPNC